MGGKSLINNVFSRGNHFQKQRDPSRAYGSLDLSRKKLDRYFTFFWEEKIFCRGSTMKSDTIYVSGEQRVLLLGKSTDQCVCAADLNHRANWDCPKLDRNVNEVHICKNKGINLRD